jgi:serine/threonine protein kinase/Tfp pilus assembly protein PilF
MHEEDPTLPLGDDPRSQVAQLERLAALDSGPRNSEWGGFHLLARVGSGGFGEVYRAWDPTLQREVALKLLVPGAIGQDDEYEATLREARALASVKHHNIVSIYGVDRHDGRVGFWTDFVRGKTLSAIVIEQGCFGYREAALIGIDVTRALSAVHRAGLLHRDIKPENVMREEGGRILLMDFGLSTLPHRSTELSGTLNYMAPELFHGAPASVAADIYAVGILLYFLVTGTHPVRLNGMTVPEAALACKQRKPLIDQRSDLPEAFLRVVNTAIDIDPAKRFPSAGAMAEALAECIGAAHPPAVASAAEAEINPKKEFKHPWTRWIIAAVVLLSIFGRRIPWIDSIFSSHKPPAVETAASGTPGLYDQYLKAQTQLNKSYKPSSLNAAFDQFQKLTKSNPDFAPAWAGLGFAEYLQFYNRQDAKLLDQAAKDSQHAIDLDKSSSTPYITLARIAAIQGNNGLALDMAHTALKLDPTNAEAYRALSAVYAAENHLPEATAAAQKAIDLSPDDWRGPGALGTLLLRQGKLPQAAEQYQRSAGLAPENRSAYYNLGIVDMRLNKLEDARMNITRALQIEPDADTYQELAWLLLAEGKYADAVAQDQKAVNLEPNSYNAWANLGVATLQLPDGAQKAIDPYRKAAELAEAVRKQQPKDAELLASLSYYYLRSGNRDRSSTLLRQALALSPDNPKIDYIAGEIYEVMGDRANAIDYIARSIGPGYSRAEIDRDPDLVNLRKDPAFQARLKSVEAAATK